MPIGAKRVILAGRAAWSFHGASLDMDFAHARAAVGGHPASITSLITFANSTGGTDLRPTSASGATFRTFAANVPRITPGTGILIEQSQTNLLLNSTAPATQTTASLGVASYTLWVNGSGSALVSAGTATITGAASATNGSPNTFNVTVAGTVTVTVTGSLNAFQLEAGTFGTSLIITAAATVTRSADSVQFTGVSLSAALRSAAAFVQFGSGIGFQTPKLVDFSSDAAQLQVASPYNIVETTSGGNSAIATLGNSLTITSPIVKCAFAYDSVSMTAVGGGGTLATNANAWGTQTAPVYLGNRSAFDRALNGYIARVSFSPVKSLFNALGSFP